MNLMQDRRFLHKRIVFKKPGSETFHFSGGEDFSHLVSGLRTIVEAVIFLDLWPGDRLGHCTAIGISPDLWIRENWENMLFATRRVVG